MLNRMLSMVYILMNKGMVTAGELAERFEVSVRTVYGLCQKRKRRGDLPDRAVCP